MSRAVTVVMYTDGCRTHFHLKSTYRLIYFASAIVGNLGLDRRLQTGSKQRMTLKFDFVKGVNKDAVSQSPEAKRAYIGLYVVSKLYVVFLLGNILTISLMYPAVIPLSCGEPMLSSTRACSRNMRSRWQAKTLLLLTRHSYTGFG